MIQDFIYFDPIFVSLFLTEKHQKPNFLFEHNFKIVSHKKYLTFNYKQIEYLNNK